MPAPNPEQPGAPQFRLDHQGLDSPHPAHARVAWPHQTQQQAKLRVCHLRRRRDGSDDERDAAHPQSRHCLRNRPARLSPDHTTHKNVRPLARRLRNWCRRSGHHFPQSTATLELCPLTCAELLPLPPLPLPHLAWASENSREDAEKIRRSPNLVLADCRVQQASDHQALAYRSLPPHRHIVGEIPSLVDTESYSRLGISRHAVAKGRSITPAANRTQNSLISLSASAMDYKSAVHMPVGTNNETYSYKRIAVRWREHRIWCEQSFRLTDARTLRQRKGECRDP